MLIRRGNCSIIQMEPVTFIASKISFRQKTWKFPDGRLAASFDAVYKIDEKSHTFMNLKNFGLAKVMDMIPVVYKQGENYATSWKELSRDLEVKAPKSEYLDAKKPRAGLMNVKFDESSEEFVKSMCEVTRQAFIDYIKLFYDEEFVEDAQRCMTIGALNVDIPAIKKAISEKKSIDDIKALADYIDGIMTSNGKVEDFVLMNTFGTTEIFYKIHAGSGTNAIYYTQSKVELANLVQKRFFAKFNLGLPSFVMTTRQDGMPNKIRMSVTANYMIVYPEKK